MASGNIKGLTIEIGGETKGLEQALSNVSKQTKSLQSELKTVEQVAALRGKKVSEI